MFFHDFDTYNFVLNGDASMTVDFGRSGPLDDGSDRIRGVEQFVFADTTKTREQLVDLIAGGER